MKVIGITPQIERFAQLGKNKSYVQSVLLGLKSAILFMPTRLYQAVKYPILALVAGLVYLLVAVAWCVVETILLLIAGFTKNLVTVVDSKD